MSTEQHIKDLEELTIGLQNRLIKCEHRLTQALMTIYTLEQSVQDHQAIVNNNDESLESAIRHIQRYNKSIADFVGLPLYSDEVCKPLVDRIKNLESTHNTLRDDVKQCVENQEYAYKCNSSVSDSINNLMKRVTELETSDGINEMIKHDFNDAIESIQNRISNIEYAYSKEKQEATHLSGGVRADMENPFGYEPDPEPEVSSVLQEMVDDGVVQLQKDVASLEQVLRECYGLNQSVDTNDALQYVKAFRQVQFDLIRGEW